MKSSWDFSIGGLRLCPLSGQRTSLLPVAPTSEQMLQLVLKVGCGPFQLVIVPSDSSGIWESNRLSVFPGH